MSCAVRVRVHRLQLGDGHECFDNPDDNSIVYDGKPLLQLTSLTHLVFSLGHLHPSPGCLSALISLRTLDINLPGLPDVLELEYEPTLGRHLGYQPVVDAHLQLFSLHNLGELYLNGPCVTTLEGIQGLSRLVALGVMHDTEVRSITPLPGLRALRELTLACTTVDSLLPLEQCRSLPDLILHGSYDQAILPRMQCLTISRWICRDSLSGL